MAAPPVRWEPCPPPPVGTPGSGRTRSDPRSRSSAGSTTSRSTRSRSRRARRSRTATACWSRRRPGRARRSWASSPCTWRWRQGRKCFYTTPIKALSNQKYADLVRRYGAERVGLLTGDNTINGEAPVVVMTTEVLRNMLYAGSGTLTGLGYVVMDEVHYLADRFRGAVWEEVIIHLPEPSRSCRCRRRCRNAEEFGEWLSRGARRHGDVVEERRPVPLWQHVMVGSRLLDLFADDERRRAAERRGHGSTPSWSGSPATTGGPSADRADAGRARGGAATGGRTAPPRAGTDAQPGRGGRAARRRGLLPAIMFVFSRAGCAAAVEQVPGAGLRLTTPAERGRDPRRTSRQRARTCPTDDLHVLGYHDFVEGLARGVAAHHAGHAADLQGGAWRSCSPAAWCKVVFATETLALGINMPARSVVIEQAVKWNGETHADVTPGEYTQLTGRAGRRGIDVEGHGVVLWQPGLDPEAVAGLASTRTYPLRSSFRPSYNMAVNLVRQVGRDAGPRAARAVVRPVPGRPRRSSGWPGRSRKARRRSPATPRPPTCDRGDFLEYARLRRGARPSASRAGQAAPARPTGTRSCESLEQLRPGDVIWVPSRPLGRARGRGRPGDALGPGRSAAAGAHRRAAGPAAVAGRLPDARSRRRPGCGCRSRSTPATRSRAATWRRSLRDRHRRPAARRTSRPGRERGVASPRPATTRAAAAASRPAGAPLPRCPDREDHARWAGALRKLERDTDGAAAPDRAADQHDRPAVRPGLRGARRAGLPRRRRGDRRPAPGWRGSTAELDLVAAECLRGGVWDGLDPAELAGGAVRRWSSRPRNPEDAEPPRLPGGRVRDVAGRRPSRLGRAGRGWSATTGSSVPAPSPTRLRLGGLAVGVGAALDDVLRRGRPGGRRLRALGQAAGRPDRPGRRRRRRHPAAPDRRARPSAALRRGVVAYSSVVELSPDRTYGLGQPARSGARAAVTRSAAPPSPHCSASRRQRCSSASSQAPIWPSTGRRSPSVQVADDRDDPRGDREVVAGVGQLAAPAWPPAARRGRGGAQDAGRGRRTACSSAAAVLSPMPGHPGQPVGRVAAQHREVGVLRGLDAVLAHGPRPRRRSRACPRRARCRATRTGRSSSTSWNRSRSPVTTSTGPSAVRGERADHVVGLVLGRADDGMPSSVERLGDHGICRSSGSGVSSTSRLAGRAPRRPGAPCTTAAGRPASAGRQSSSQQRDDRAGLRRSSTSRAMKSSSPRTALTGVPSGALHACRARRRRRGSTARRCRAASSGPAHGRHPRR